MTHGMLTIEELARKVTSGDIDTVVVGFTDHYGRVHGKRFDAGYYLEEVGSAGTHGCDYLLTVDMEMEPVPGYQYANWELGYGDFHMVPDHDTIREATWLDRTAMVLCDLHDPHHHDHVRVAPRSILRHQLERAGRLGLHGQGRIGARVLPVRGQLPRGGHPQVSGPDPGRLVHRGLSPAAGDPGREVQRGRAPPPLELRGFPSRTPKGNGGGVSTR